METLFCIAPKGRPFAPTTAPVGDEKTREPFLDLRYKRKGKAWTLLWELDSRDAKSEHLKGSVEA